MKTLIIIILASVLNPYSTLVRGSQAVNNVYFSYNPHYSSTSGSWTITMDYGIGITTTFSGLFLNAYNNKDSFCTSSINYYDQMPEIVFRNISTGATRPVPKLPSGVKSWKLNPGWVLVNSIEFSDGSLVLLDNGVVLSLHIQNQSCAWY